jgi:hypothetical protein
MFLTLQLNDHNNHLPLYFDYIISITLFRLHYLDYIISITLCISSIFSSVTCYLSLSDFLCCRLETIFFSLHLASKLFLAWPMCVLYPSFVLLVLLAKCPEDSYFLNLFSKHQEIGSSPFRLQNQNSKESNKFLVGITKQPK